ncbi:MAG: hypothetical protein PHH27_02120 [Candidatus Colwellbacteria bacterium]|jgi:hypothetical protein|nr:hypothetical protein [Candidatus Colwellbacteria bacterium]
MKSIAEKTAMIASIASDFHKTCGGEILFKVSSFKMETAPNYGEIKLFPIQEDFGEINIFIYSNSLIIQAPLGPAHRFGEYLRDELNALKKDIGIPCELQGI